MQGYQKSVSFGTSFVSESMLHFQVMNLWSLRCMRESVLQLALTGTRHLFSGK